MLGALNPGKIPGKIITILLFGTSNLHGMHWEAVFRQEPIYVQNPIHPIQSARPTLIAAIYQLFGGAGGPIFAATRIPVS